ncbi:hypothetical protein [Thermogutta sp.]|uniref:hypothetical protein n=1 Tax=Thermogutta sp. TaxID=1962930 RepID=UPI00321F9936
MKERIATFMAQEISLPTWPLYDPHNKLMVAIMALAPFTLVIVLAYGLQIIQVNVFAGVVLGAIIAQFSTRWAVAVWWATSLAFSVLVFAERPIRRFAPEMLILQVAGAILLGVIGLGIIGL